MLAHLQLECHYVAVLQLHASYAFLLGC